MCGILGVINGASGFDQGLCNFVAQGSLWGLVRGDDSTGTFQVNKAWGVRTHKLDIDGYHYARNKRSQEIFRAVDTTYATILHHRAATHGTVSQENAHPFEHYTEDGMVVGVHNGTLDQWDRTEDKLRFEVDSDWLYYKISKHGAKEALSQHIRGAYALVWAETPSNKLHIAANGGRPIHWGFVEGKNVMLIASEAPMLYALANRNGLNLERAMYPEKGKIYTFDPAQNLRNFSVEDVPEAPQPVTRRDARHTRPSVQMVRENEDIVVEDVYTPSCLAGTGFKHMESVEFFFSKHSPTQDNTQNRYDLHGELMKNLDNENGGVLVRDSIIRCMSQVVLDNVREADKVMCNVIGVRNIRDKKTALATTQIILSPPDVTFFNSNKDALTREDPWEEPLTVIGPNKTDITSRHFLELVKDGCCGCGDPLTLKDAGNVSWYAAGNIQYPVCASCCHDPSFTGAIL